MRHRIFIAVVLVVAALGLGSVGVYAYDATRDDLIADGVSIAGIDVGGMRASEARAAVERDLVAPLTRRITVRAGGRRFRLSARRAGVRADVEAMVQEALDASREGSLISRTFRGLTGGDVDRDVDPRVTYSREAVSALVRRVKRRVDRKPKNASVTPSRTGLQQVAGRNGLAVRGRELERALDAEITSPDADGVVRARTKVTRPEVTTAELADRYPHFLVVDRSTFKLRFYKRLRLAKTYTVAVGAAGFDTPAGTYAIQNKAVNPVWSVPNSDWAGELAGRQIPPGPQNPIKARWMGIYDGAGIHGTDAVGSIGSRASHGCVRMLIPEVIELYDQVPVGTPVYIGG